ncbi:MAG: SMI1/KNR4 family protein [Candidatus Cardinium sp.]
MNAKLFFTLSLFGYMGINACNGTNINGMDKKPIGQSSEIKAGSSHSSGSSTASSEEKNGKTIRLEAIEQLNNMVKKELGYEFPKGYKDFLLEYDPNRLKDEGLEPGGPLCVFSFETPENKQNIQAIVCREMRRYRSKAHSFPRNQDATSKVNIPLCIAVHSEAHNYKDGDEDEAMVYYYIDLNPTEHKDRPLKVYSVLRDNKVESIREDNMIDFLKYCQKVAKGIKKSIEDIEKKRKNKRST